MSPHTSSSLPKSECGLHIQRFLFGLAPSGVYHRRLCYHERGAALTAPFHPYCRDIRQRYTFCCTFRRLSPPRCYLALCPMEPGLSSQSITSIITGRLSSWLNHTISDLTYPYIVHIFNCIIHLMH
ncbi:hypothetical protein CEAn_00206 [Coxiella endosymbiont of Amblyomma nuttalli]|nr:hypothetical protein CEAn_00206 [Coxiella endosymbiont of Amblyomma nuttalli]